jgi:hypothetical protein
MFDKSQVIDALAPVIEAERNGEDGFPIFQALADQHANLSPDETREVFRRAREAYLNLNEDAAFDVIIAAVNGTVTVAPTSTEVQQGLDEGFALLSEVAQEFSVDLTEGEGDTYPTEDEEEIDSSRIAFDNEVRNLVHYVLKARPEERVDLVVEALNRQGYSQGVTESEIPTVIRALDNALFDGGLDAATKVALAFVAQVEDRIKQPEEYTTTLSVEERIARLENIARGQGLL